MANPEISLDWSVGDTVYNSTERKPDHVCVRAKLYTIRDLDKLVHGLSRIRDVMPDEPEEKPAEDE